MQKEFYIIEYFDLNGHYLGTIKCVFGSKSAARGYIKACSDCPWKFQLVQVDYIN